MVGLAHLSCFPFPLPCLGLYLLAIRVRMGFPLWTVRSSSTIYKTVCGRFQQPEAHDFSRVYFTVVRTFLAMNNAAFPFRLPRSVLFRCLTTIVVCCHDYVNGIVSDNSKETQVRCCRTLSAEPTARVRLRHVFVALLCRLCIACSM